MGKNEANLQQQQQQQQQQQRSSNNGAAQNSSRCICAGCRLVFNTLSKQLSFRCVVVLILSLSIFFSGIFWILHYHATKSRFDAQDAVKLNATVQAYFKLEKPVMDLVPHIGRLEYDINGEIGVPGTKVAILSMHQFNASDLTDVVFGVLSDPINVPIVPVFLSVLRSSFIELFLKQTNLSLTTSIFGKPSMFEILKYPGGITVIPWQSASIWQEPQILFNFTLNNSISEIVDNFVQLKEQLRFGLHLRSNEDVFLRITNKLGSTKAATVVVQADLVSDLGRIVPQRLKQLAETITGSPAENLGLNNTVFGRVKSISLSQKPSGTRPTASPAPSPEPSTSRYPTSRVYSPAPSPELHHLQPAPVPDIHRLRPAPSPEIHHLPPALSPDIHLLPPAPSPDYHHPPPAPSPGIHLLPQVPSPGRHHLPKAPSPGIHHLPQAPSPGIHQLPAAPSPDIRPLPAAPSPDIRPLPPAPSPGIDHLPPAPSKVPAHPRRCPYQGSRIPPSSSPTSHPNPTAPPSYASTSFPHSPSMSPSSQVSPPLVYYASGPDNKGSAPDLKSPSPAQSLPLSAGDFYKESRLLEFSGLLIFYLLCCWR